MSYQDIEVDQIMKDRDHWTSKASELAKEVGEILGFEIGEHTSDNCPVQNAIDGLWEMRTQIAEWQKESQ